jgi:hypothetical protein
MSAFGGKADIGLATGDVDAPLDSIDKIDAAAEQRAAT